MPQPKRSRGDSTSSALSFPLNDSDRTRFLDVARQAGVGGEGAPPGGSIVNTEARVTWQVLPNQLSILNLDIFNKDTLGPIVASISEGLGIASDWKLQPVLYKMLLYDPGCYFRLHRDTERIPDMVATLVVQLPSSYTGALLEVRSPMSPDDERAVTYDMSTKGAGRSIHYAAFYNDCLHSVSDLSEGHRVCLVYSVTATKLPLIPPGRFGSATLSHPSRLPPQPADVQIAIDVAAAVRDWSDASDPTKLAIVLQHRYTPDSLKAGMLCLKGQDRAVAEILNASRFRVVAVPAAS